MRGIFEPADKPKSVLGYHRILSPKAGVRCSPLCLGAMSFGDAWASMLGPCDKKTSFEILDYFYDQGGNFIDTANNYQDEESETWIGEWMQQKGVREEIVLATKFTTGYKISQMGKMQLSNHGGNHTKSMFNSVHASLKKLQTDYIDLLYVHWWDWSTSIEELMQSLNILIKQGKVLYLGVSDTPAWVVAQCNEYARQNALRGFSVYQGKWNAGFRDLEREIIPMCQHEGMAIAPWSALGGGQFKTEEQRKNNDGRQGQASEADLKISAALEKVGERKGTVMTSVALAYVMHKTPNVFPIVGGRKVEHLKGNIEALKLVLSDEDIEEIEDAAPFDVGFPMSFLHIGAKNNTKVKTNDVTLVNANALLDVPEKQGPVKPRQE